MRRLFLLLFAGTLCGCGGAEGAADRPETHPVTGKVTYKGSPLADAQIVFNPEGTSGQGAFARTDKDGNYSLMTFEPGDGAVAGKYLVTVAKYDVPPAPTEDTADEEPSDGDEETAKNLLPVKYSLKDQSGLTAEVTDGGENKFDFALTA